MVIKGKSKPGAGDDIKRTQNREQIRGLYINREMKARFERLQGRTINLQRTDPEGNEYVEAYEVPDKIIAMARDALFEFFTELESIEGLDHDIRDFQDS